MKVFIELKQLIKSEMCMKVLNEYDGNWYDYFSIDGKGKYISFDRKSKMIKNVIAAFKIDQEICNVKSRILNDLKILFYTGDFYMGDDACENPYFFNIIMKEADLAKPTINLMYKSEIYKQTLLVRLVKERDIALVKNFISEGIDVNIDGNRSLMEAVKGKDDELVKILLLGGADPDWAKCTSEETLYTSNKGAHMYESILCEAARMGSVEIVKLLIAAGADIAVNNHAALHIAVEKEHIDVVKELIFEGIDVNSHDGWALFLAVYPKAKELVTVSGERKEIALISFNQEHMVDLLLSAGISIYTRMYNESLRSIECCEREFQDCMKSENASRKIYDRIKYSLIKRRNSYAYYSADTKDYHQCMTSQKIRDERTSAKLQQILSISGFLNIHAKQLYEKTQRDKNNIMIRDMYIEIELQVWKYYFAAENGYIEILEALISIGIDAHVDNNKAFKLAARAGHKNIIIRLLKENINLETIQVALSEVIRAEKFDVVQVLFAAGADITKVEGLEDALEKLLSLYVRNLINIIKHLPNEMSVSLRETELIKKIVIEFVNQEMQVGGDSRDKSLVKEEIKAVYDIIRSEDKLKEMFEERSEKLNGVLYFPGSPNRKLLVKLRKAFFELNRNREIYNAVMIYKDKAEIKRLVDDGADPLLRLYRATQSGDISVIGRMFEAGVYVDDTCKVILLKVAYDSGHIPVIDILLKSGIDIDRLKDLDNKILSEILKVYTGNLVQEIRFAYGQESSKEKAARALSCDTDVSLFDRLKIVFSEYKNAKLEDELEEVNLLKMTEEKQIVDISEGMSYC